MPRSKPGHAKRNGNHPNEPFLGGAQLSVPADARLYVNRELSLLKFFQRVLEEAQDETQPLLERIKFLSIVGSNLAEQLEAQNANGVVM